MKVNFKQPKYVLPLIAFPFLALGNYLYLDSFKEEPVVVVTEEGMQSNISEASENVKGAEMSDKLNAYTNTYKNGDGYTAMSGIEDEEEDLPQYENLYSQTEKARLDSLDEALNRQISQSQISSYNNVNNGYSPQSRNSNSKDDELLKLLINSQNQTQQNPTHETREEDKEMDPMEMMKAQYALIDSIEKSNDTEYRVEKKRQDEQLKAEKLAEEMKMRKLTVHRTRQNRDGFNTIRREQEKGFISAIIDEDITGYAGSRIRIRLLEDIKVGTNLITKGTYLYAIINSFGEQRVGMQITSIMYKNKVLPINLSIFDRDGMEGLYVPASAFREFTKELGSTSMQGMQINQTSTTQQEFLMSSIQRAFQSTSEAVAKAIRKNKAKFKYNTFVYLIDTQELQDQQNNKN
ncbi:conjugative transposon protein TraM [Sphingobacterium sp.]|uniref:conjugative transposon protein TraM n=1 Tax=Sphingobacterium sp. TaxID=341027 RepID=UPI0028A631D0|nr:conjugative transposon protein TraM [Sphingobacterium sp.]